MRARPRHVHASCIALVRAELARLQWDTAGGAKTAPVTMIDYEPAVGSQLAPNTVGVTLGPEGSTKVIELGGGLRAVEYTVFVDVYGESASIALHLASDILDLFVEAYVPLYDYTTDPAVLSTDTLEVTDCYRTEPQVTAQAEFQRHWQIVKLTLRCEYVPT